MLIYTVRPCAKWSLIISTILISPLSK